MGKVPEEEKIKADDVYKDDFSSDDEAITVQKAISPDQLATDNDQNFQIGTFRAANLVFEDSIRDNFQMQEASDTLRKIFD